MTIRGKRPRWSGLRLRRRRTEISSIRPSLIAGLTNTVFQAANAITRCRTNRWNRPSERAANLPPSRSLSDRADGNSVHNLHPSGYGSLECQDRHLAFSCVRSDALWRAFLRLHFSAPRFSARHVAARITQCSGRHDEHRDFDHVVSNGRTGMGLVEDETISRLLVVYARHDFMRRDFFNGQTGLRMAAEVRAFRRLY